MGAGTAERSSGLFVSPPLLLLSDRKQTGERTIGNICFPRRPVRRNHVGFSLTLHERNSQQVKLSKEGIKKKLLFLEDWRKWHLFLCGEKKNKRVFKPQKIKTCSR